MHAMETRVPSFDSMKQYLPIPIDRIIIMLKHYSDLRFKSGSHIPAVCRRAIVVSSSTK